MRKYLSILAGLLTLSVLLDVPLAAMPPGGNGGGGGGKNDEPPPDPAIVFDAWKNYSVDLMVSNADGTNQTVLRAGDPYYHFPSWSPDGNSLVYEEYDSATDIVLLHLIDLAVVDGSLEVGAAIPLVEGFLPAWSPQGNLIAYVGNHPQPTGIFVIDPDGVETLLVPDPIPGDGNYDVGWPAWSPDGTHLAYSRRDPLTGQRSVWIKEVVDATGMLIDGPETHVIDTGNIDAQGLDWSRGGQHLAYKLGWQDPIHIVDLFQDPPALSLLVENELAQSESPSWTPSTDDTELIFINRKGRAGSGERRIVKHNRLTNEETVLVERKGYHLYWPDRRRF
jgi:Tol biopolymer transport system component